jgi:hypothetical protein
VESAPRGEAASILLTMRQRQQSELRKLMCVYDFSSSKRASSIPHSRVPVAGEGEKTSKDSVLRSSHDRELKRKIFVLQIVQPGLPGLMDGSVSTLAPVFAAAFAKQFSDRFPRWDGGFERRRNQYGIRRGSFRRWSPQRPRASLDARRSLWHHDDFRWNRTYYALSVAGFLSRPLGCRRSGRNRVRCHCLDKEAFG